MNGSSFPPINLVSFNLNNWRNWKNKTENCLIWRNCNEQSHPTSKFPSFLLLSKTLIIAKHTCKGRSEKWVSIRPDPATWSKLLIVDDEVLWPYSPKPQIVPPLQPYRRAPPKIPEWHDLEKCIIYQSQDEWIDGETLGRAIFALSLNLMQKGVKETIYEAFLSYTKQVLV